MEELARLAPGSADVADLFKRRSIQDRDTFVRSVRDIDETLFGVGRQRNAECSSGSLRFAFDESFPQKGAVQPERLDAVVGAIRDIHDAIIGDRNAVRRVELLGPRTGDLARLRSLVVRLGAIGA